MRQFICFLITYALASQQLPADEIRFNRDIRPILSETCFVCHGPDEAQLQAGLRLDLRDKATGESDSGERAIVPGDVDQSHLVARISSDDESERMPPPEFGKTLTPKQIAILKQWIAEGAKYEGHWAFTPPVPPLIPTVEASHSSWPRNTIDHFVLSRLAGKGWKPSSLADKSTLIRRLTLDLTGLPPTATEVDAYLADRSDDAYEKLVDRLLMSPNYGERMALPWLDFARYADSNGFQSDGSRTLWAWRDWLINAINENKPFDQFTVEQLAGDMLPDATKDQIIATGFNRNHRLNGEGGRIVDEWFVETVIDRVETTGMTWMGLTFNCCRCHDHKYDPISQKEFYQMFAFFNSVEESGVLAAGGKNGDNTPPLLSLGTDEQVAELAKLRKVVTDAAAKIKGVNKTLPKRLAQWEQQQKSNSQQQAAWTPFSEPNSVSDGEADFKTIDNGRLLVKGKNPKFDTYTISTAIQSKTLTGLMLEVFPHKSLARKGLGRGGNGNFVLTQLNAVIESADAPPVPISFDQADADFEQTGWTAESLRIQQHTQLSDAAKRKGWAIAGHEKKNQVPHKLILSVNTPIELPADAVLRVTMKHASPYAGHNIGCFRLSTSDSDPTTLSVDGFKLPKPIQQTLAKKLGDRTADEKKKLREYFSKEIDAPLKDAAASRDKAKAAADAYEKKIPTTMVMKEAAPRDAFILLRGEYDKPGDKVQRGLPSVLPPLPEGEKMDRLGLANWIVDPSNPLTARVWVNRAWEHFFGTGLVKTTENFGSQAEYPSHPALLDWLATEFMAPTKLPDVNGTKAQAWDTKAIHKAIVMSATYRQSSHVTPELMQQDPHNRFFARGPRFRLAGELIRDSALFASGLLVNQIGGPSVRPYMPEKVWDETSVYGNLRNYKHDTGEGLHRRTMYTIWKRTAAPPTMLLFDAPNRETCTIKRSRTNTPLQALSLLNEVTFVETARALAARMINEGGVSAQSRIKFAYKTLFAREPTADELLILKAGIDSDLKHFAKDTDAAKKLIAVGQWKPDKELDATQWAAYIMTANVLLNLDEFVTRD